MNRSSQQPRKQIEVILSAAGLILILQGAHWIRLTALPKQESMFGSMKKASIKDLRDHKDHR